MIPAVKPYKESGEGHLSAITLYYDNGQKYTTKVAISRSIRLLEFWGSKTKSVKNLEMSATICL